MSKIFYKLLKPLILILSFCAHADESIDIELQNNKMHPITMFLLMEGMLGVNAWLASENPHAYGAVGALLFPVAAGEGSKSETETWVGIIGAESIAVYNLSIDEDEKSKNEIFKSNMIAWHLFAGVLITTKYIIGDNDGSKSLSINPTRNGGVQLVYNYKF